MIQLETCNKETARKSYRLGVNMKVHRLIKKTCNIAAEEIGKLLRNDMKSYAVKMLQILKRSVCCHPSNSEQVVSSDYSKPIVHRECVMVT